MKHFYQQGSITMQALVLLEHRCLSARLSVTLWYCIKTNKASVIISSSTERLKTLQIRIIPKFERVHPEQGRFMRLPVSDKLKSLGVTIDSSLRFDCHASNVARACNYHTRALRYVRSLLTDETAVQYCGFSP